MLDNNYLTSKTTMFTCFYYFSYYYACVSVYKKMLESFTFICLVFRFIYYYYLKYLHGIVVFNCFVCYIC